jgi:hypothetical protein
VLERLILIQQSALNLRPLPTRSELTQQLSGILAPLLPSIPLGGDGVRSVGGLSQVMVGESRYVAVFFRSLLSHLLIRPTYNGTTWAFLS